MPYKYFYEKVTGTGKYNKFSATPSIDELAIQQGSRGGTTASIVDYEELANLLNQRMINKSGGNNQRLAIMLGMFTKDKNNPIKANIPDGEKSAFSLEKYQFFLNAPFEISNRCCTAMKKQPAHDYGKRTGRVPMTAEMADESRLRLQKWLQNGCNGFNMKSPKSTPMAFWTEQDVLMYLKTRNLPICSVYGDIVEDFNAEGQIDGQMSLIYNDNPILKTTGCDRTGCMLCGFGCHLDKAGEGRFERLKQTHPKMYNLLDVVQNNGITYREAIEWTNEHGNLNIRL